MALAPALLDLIGTASAAAAAAGPTVLTLPVPADKKARLYGFDVTAGPGAAAPVGVTVTVAGLQGPDLVYQFTHNLTDPDPLQIEYPVPLVTCENGTDITITVTGGANAGAISINGYAALEG